MLRIEINYHFCRQSVHYTLRIRFLDSVSKSTVVKNCDSICKAPRETYDTRKCYKQDLDAIQWTDIWAWVLISFRQTWSGDRNKLFGHWLLQFSSSPSAHLCCQPDTYTKQRSISRILDTRKIYISNVISVKCSQ